MKFELVILDGPDAGRRIPVPASPVTFGRAPAAAMAFPDDGFISSVHLSVQGEGEGVRITDLRSTNGTFLNSERVSSALAEVGDVIQIGTMTMQVAQAKVTSPAAPVFSAAAPPPSAPPSAPPLDAIIARDLPRMDVPAPPPLPPSIVATTTIPRIAVDTFEKFRRNDVKKPDAASPLTALRQRLEVVATPLFLMVNAGADEGITARLAMADVDLLKHALWAEGSAAAARWAPYLIPIKADAPLLNALVDGGWGKGWVSVLAASVPLEDLIEHFHKFLKVQMDATGGVYFRFYEPQVLREFLPSGSAAEVAMFFGPVQDWFLEGDSKTTLLHASHSPAGLQTETLSLDVN